MKEQIEITPGSTALATVNGNQDMTVAGMLQAAIERGLGPEQLNQLVTLYERMDARRAAQEFATAMNDFQNDCPTVFKNKAVNTGKYTYDYSTLPYVLQTVRPYLQKHGLSYTADVKLDNNFVTVITIVRHVGGHKEETTFTAPVDKASVMNDTQKVASATSYARRYGLCLALGIMTGGDDDGVSAGNGERITETQIADLEVMIQEVGADKARFLKFLKVESLAQLPAKEHGKAVHVLNQKRGMTR